MSPAAFSIAKGSISGNWTISREATQSVVGFPEAEPITNEQLLMHALRYPGARGPGTADHRGECRRRSNAEFWPKAANGPTTPEADIILERAARDFYHSRYSLQRGRRDRLLLRMGAGSAELLLDRNRSRGQTVPDAGRSLHADARDEPQTENLDAPGGAELGIKRVQEAKKIRGLFP